MNYYVKKPEYIDIFNKGIRDKKDLVNGLIKLITLFNTFSYESIKAKDKSDADVLIIVERMCRCFIVEANSIHTFQIPFTIRQYDAYLSFLYEDEPIDSKMCAILESWISRYWNESFENIFDFWADLEEDEEDYNTGSNCYQDRFWRMYLELLQFESGYVRYDHDELRQDEDTHPKDHLDIFYSSNCTFKLGLRKEIDVGVFSRILNVNDRKCYIESNEQWKKMNKK